MALITHGPVARRGPAAQVGRTPVRRGSRHHAHAERRYIRGIIDTLAFEPVYQPVVDIGRGSVLGHHLLTRFHDGRSPDRHFASARAVGLERQLELATLRRGIEAARALPGDGWLSVIVSPDLVLASVQMDRLREIPGSRPLVIELAEHRAADDLRRVRAAVNGLQIGVSLALDTPTSNYACLRHMLELGPAYVKIGGAIVRGVGAHPVHQDVVACLRYFADVAGCEPIADAVETESERRTLKGLGIVLGRGYLFGRPIPAAPA